MLAKKLVNPYATAMPSGTATIMAFDQVQLDTSGHGGDAMRLSRAADASLPLTPR